MQTRTSSRNFLPLTSRCSQIVNKIFFMGKIFLCSVCIVMLYSSCEKCLHCVYTYTDSSGVVQTVDVGEMCGKEQDIKALEDSCAAIVQIVGGTCTCTGK